MRKRLVLAGLLISVLLAFAGWRLYFLLARESVPTAVSTMPEDSMRPANLPRR